MIKDSYKIQAINVLASEYVQKNLSLLNGMPTNLEHVENILASILMTKHGIGYPGGGFVQAVVDNDLLSAVEKADLINRKAIVLHAAGCNYIRLSDIEQLAGEYQQEAKV